MALAVLFILREQVPAVDAWFQSLVAPEQHAAAEACRRAALQAASQPDYARVRRQGTVHPTQNGFYVEAVEIGEMGTDGAESIYRFSCYADRTGALVNTHKQTAGNEHPGRQSTM
jgi:hypothetical protein